MVNNMDKIDFKLDQTPKNIPVEVYYPDGTLLVITDNALELDYIRNIICDNKAEGYYLMFKGQRHEILPNGRVDNWPYGMFDTYQYLLARLLCRDFSEENAISKFNTTIWEDLEDRNKRIEETYNKV